MKKALAAILLATVVWAGSKGTAPRSDASRYPAHAEREGTALGAIVLSPEQVRRAFTTDIARCCVVVEVAVYPQSGKPVDISGADFTLRIAGTEIAAKPSSARLLAGTLQKTAPAEREISVHPTVGIAYESGPRGYDPVAGERRGGGVRTMAGVGVGVGDSRPASTERDRDVMELELGEKGLPEGMASAPASGFLYFALTTKRKNPAYQLEYTGLGGKVVLRFP